MHWTRQILCKLHTYVHTYARTNDGLVEEVNGEVPQCSDGSSCHCVTLWYCQWDNGGQSLTKANHLTLISSPLYEETAKHTTGILRIQMNIRTYVHMEVQCSLYICMCRHTHWLQDQHDTATTSTACNLQQRWPFQDTGTYVCNVQILKMFCPHTAWMNCIHPRCPTLFIA